MIEENARPNDAERFAANSMVEEIEERLKRNDKTQTCKRAALYDTAVNEE